MALCPSITGGALRQSVPREWPFVEWLIANELIAFSNLLSEKEPQRLLRKRTPRNPGKNHWISSRDREFGSWWAALTDRRMLDRQGQLEFYLKFLEAGERERLLVVKQSSVQNPFSYRESMGISYSQHLKQTVHHHGEHFLNGLYGNIWDTQIASRLCYYDLDGCLTEGEVENIGGLLGELRPQDLEYGDRWEGFHHNRPIEIYYNWYDPGYDGDEPVFAVRIQLPTDIWYPEVEGFLDKNIINWTGVYPSEDWMDNLELSRCHTPRLNRFLAEFKQLTLEFGGEWGDPDYPNNRRKDGIPLP
jgi:hypothetical protein